MYILGSGLAGCLAAIRHERALVIEANEQATVNHRAVLRMRSEVVSQLTGIPFKKVTIRKFVYDDESGYSKVATPEQIITYSLKATNTLSVRSIVNLNDDVRYIPPHDFHQQLLNRLDGRIQFGRKVQSVDRDFICTDLGITHRTDMPVISTIPLHAMLRMTKTEHDFLFVGMHKKIHVSEFELANCNLHMTIYFPDFETNIYRVSFIGNILNIESIGELTQSDIHNIFEMFHLYKNQSNVIVLNHEQNLGKITPIDDVKRKSLLFKLTSDLGIYSLGRFACWRNILLDDVVHDIDQINRMMTTHPYERALS